MDEVDGSRLGEVKEEDCFGKVNISMPYFYGINPSVPRSTGNPTTVQSPFYVPIYTSILPYLYSRVAHDRPLPRFYNRQFINAHPQTAQHLLQIQIHTQCSLSCTHIYNISMYTHSLTFITHLGRYMRLLLPAPQFCFPLTMEMINSRQGQSIPNSSAVPSK